MATGSLNAQGVWIYGEDDSETTFSALLNKLGTSVSSNMKGRIAQVIHGSTATTVTNSTGTAIDTGLTATITPTSATSKILVLVSQNGMYTSKPTAGAFTAVDGLTLFRGASGISNFGNLIGYTPIGNETFHVGYSASMTIFDNPATTSAITYKTRFYNYAGTSGTVAVQAYGSRSTITLVEITS